MLFNIKMLKRVFPNYKGKLNEADGINHVTIDSRDEQENSLFIPIVGERFDGHDFLKQAIENGAVASLWDETKDLPHFVPDYFPVFFVSNTTGALQELAAHYRQEINPTVIGITGSNGKTTTKDITSAILKTSYKTHATKGNFNNDIGLPLTILSMPRQTDMLVLEMGMNAFGEIELLSKLAKPDYAIITNIGESHIEHLGSREGIARAKLEIKEGLKKDGRLIIDGDEALLLGVHLQENVIKCGFGNENDYIISDINLSETGTRFTLKNHSSYNTPLFGAHHALNTTLAISLSKLVGISDENIQKGLNNLDYTAMRFEFLTSHHKARLINDAYNASPTSMIGAINVVKEFKEYSKKILVLGDILELGDFAEDFHEEIAKSIKKPITHLLTYGRHARLMSRYVKEHEEDILSEHFETKESLVTYLKNLLDDDCIVLFKASRGMAFESIVNELI